MVTVMVQGSRGGCIHGGCIHGAGVHAVVVVVQGAIQEVFAIPSANGLT